MSGNERAGSPRNPGVAFEPRDANVRALLYIGIGILVSAVVIHLAVYLLFDFFAARESRRGLQPSTTVRAGRMKEPPEPQLQVDPPRDLEELRRAQGEKLHGYDWVDEKAGTVRIPIERAMELLVQRGLPQAQQAQPTTATNATGQSQTMGAAGQNQNASTTEQKQTLNTNASQAEARGTTTGAASGRKAGKKQQ